MGYMKRCHKAKDGSVGASLHVLVQVNGHRRVCWGSRPRDKGSLDGELGLLLW